MKEQTYNRCLECGKHLLGDQDMCTPCKHLREAYQRGLAEGRQLERAAIVAWLRERKTEPVHMYLYVSTAIERADHLRPDIKDGEG